MPRLRLARLLLAAIALLLAPARAHAQNLFLRDLQSAGDQKLLFDRASGLEWLRISNTVGQAYWSLQNAMNGGSLSGWRFATRAEVAELACNAALTCAGTSSGPLAQLIGGSYCPQPLCIAAAEWNSIFWTKDSGDEIYWQGPGGSLPTLGKYTYLNLAELRNPPIGILPGYDPRYAYNGIGSALVRTTTPEPASVALLAAGLLAVGGAARRRRARG